MGDFMLPFQAALAFLPLVGVTDGGPPLNAWPNPSAELDCSGASGRANGRELAVSQQPADAWRGRRCFELRGPADPGDVAILFGAGEGPAVAVTPGRTAFFRVAGRLADGTAQTLELRALWLDSGGAPIVETPALCYADLPDRHPWVVLDGWDTAPPGAARVALALYAVGGSGSLLLRADGVQISLDPGRFVDYVDGDEPGAAWLGQPHASPSRAAAGALNLVPNPSFERGSQGWRSGAAGGSVVTLLERDATWAAAGRASLRLTGSVGEPANAYVAMLSEAIPVVGGQEYTLRATLNLARIPESGRVALCLGWLDSNGRYLLAESLTDCAATGSLGVTELAVTKPAPREAVAALAVVGSQGSIAGDYDFRADAFSLMADTGAAPSRPFWVGFNDQTLNRGPLTVAQDVDYSRRLGVNTVRLPFNLSLNDLWRQVWPGPEAPINLAPLTPTVRAFEAAGIRLLLLSPLTPWMLKNGRIDPEQYDKVGQLTAACVKEWPQIVAVEPHNEPNTAHFWPPGADPALFVRYLAAVSRAVKAVAPDMPILAPSCNAALTKGRNLSITDFMNGFFAAGGGDWCDALSIHPYPYGASSGSGSDRRRDFWAGSVDCMQQLRAARDAAGLQSKPIWITELGSATTDPSYPPLLKTITEAQQAASTALLYDWARRQPDVRAVIYHTNASRDSHPEGDYGLFEANGRLKPAFGALEAELHRSPPAYFDGDSPAAQWLGPPGSSPSLAPGS